MIETPIQKRIENAVSSKRGYDRKNTARTPFYLMDNEIGLQVALANMELVDGRLDSYEGMIFGPKLEAMIKKFNDSGIPLETITTPEGFKAAFNAAYTPLKSEEIYSLARLTIPVEFREKIYGPTNLIKGLNLLELDNNQDSRLELIERLDNGEPNNNPDYGNRLTDFLSGKEPDNNLDYRDRLIKPLIPWKHHLG